MKKNDLSVYLFHEGTNYYTHHYLGSHFEGKRTVFRVWAPSADDIFLVCDLNFWSENSLPMKKTDGDIWEISLPGRLSGMKYKYRILKDGQSSLKADPFAFASETREKNASVVCDIGGFEWHDKEWMEYRKKQAKKAPMLIYEIHLGSWKKGLSYREIGDELIPYLKETGFTHVEFLPLCEHPLDDS